MAERGSQWEAFLWVIRCSAFSYEYPEVIHAPRLLGAADLIEVEVFFAPADASGRLSRGFSVYCAVRGSIIPGAVALIVFRENTPKLCMMYNARAYFRLDPERWPSLRRHLDATVSFSFISCFGSATAGTRT